MIPMQKSSCSVEYSMSLGENSAARISSLSSTVPPSPAASARASELLPEPGSPAIRISMVLTKLSCIGDCDPESFDAASQQAANGLQRTPGSDRADHPPTAGGQRCGDRGAPRIRDIRRILPHDVVFKSAKVSGSGGIVGNWDRYSGKRRERPVHRSLAEGFETVAGFGTIGEDRV